MAIMKPEDSGKSPRKLGKNEEELLGYGKALLSGFTPDASRARQAGNAYMEIPEPKELDIPSEENNLVQSEVPQPLPELDAMKLLGIQIPSQVDQETEGEVPDEVTDEVTMSDSSPLQQKNTTPPPPPSPQQSKLEKLLSEYRNLQQASRDRLSEARLADSKTQMMNSMLGGVDKIANAFANRAGITKINNQTQGMSADQAKNVQADLDILTREYKLINDIQKGQATKDKVYQTRSGLVKIDENGNPVQIYEDPVIKKMMEQADKRISQGDSRESRLKDAFEFNKAEKQELTPAQAKEVKDIDVTLDSLEKLEGMKTFSTGPIAGRLEAIRRSIGQSPAKKEALISQLNMIVSQYGKAISGSAIAEPEFVRIQSQLPKETDNDSVFAAKLANFQDEMLNSRARVLETYKLAGKDTTPLMQRRGIEEIRKEQEQGRSSTVRVIDPQGKIRMIPRSQLDAALKAGGQLAE